MASQQPLGAGRGAPRAPLPAQTGLDPASPEAAEERRQAILNVAIAWQRLTYANDNKAADIIMRAGQAAFGEEEFGAARQWAIENMP
ncbi:hypothetical protein LTR08_002969 [Meristemomyces frigidus]|nr:hypothetical protein LTR08_002969 [Meristemomyces frigidus]